MRLLLSQLQYDLLLKHLPDKAKEMLLHDIKSPTEGSRQIHVEIKDSEREVIINYLTDLLIAEGLNDNDEPNKTGYEIENLIDIFQVYE